MIVILELAANGLQLAGHLLIIKGFSGVRVFLQQVGLHHGSGKIFRYQPHNLSRLYDVGAHRFEHIRRRRDISRADIAASSTHLHIFNHADDWHKNESYAVAIYTELVKTILSDLHKYVYTS